MKSISKITTGNPQIIELTDKRDPKASLIQKIVLERLKNNLDAPFVQWCVSKILKDRRIKRLSVNDVAKIEACAQKIIHCVDATPIDFSDISIPDKEKDLLCILKKFFFRSGSQNHTSKFINRILFKSKSKNYSEICHVIQKILESLWKQMKENDNPDFNKKISTVVSQIISYLPYFYPEKITTKQMKIPQLINGKWEFVTFNIGKTKLRPQRKIWNIFSKMFGEAVDIVELDPIESDRNLGARSIRSFQGTALFSGKGCIQTILADTFPLSSVGEMFIFFAKGAIRKSFDKSHTTKKIDLYGHSLGGSKAMLASLAFAKKVNQVITFGAPKLYSWSINRMLSRLRKSKMGYKPKVTCIVNANDTIPLAGNALPPGVKTIEITGREILTKYKAHLKILAAHDQILMKKLSKREVKGWSIIAVIHLIVSPIIFVVVGAFFFVWRLLVSLLYTLPKTAIDSAVKACKPKKTVLVPA